MRCTVPTCGNYCWCVCRDGPKDAKVNDILDSLAGSETEDAEIEKEDGDFGEEQGAIRQHRLGI